MFLIAVNYVKPLERIDELIPAHREFLDRYYRVGRFILSGGRNPRVGGMILALGTSERELWDIIREDPFYIDHAAEYELTEIIPTRCIPILNEICGIKTDG